MIVYLATCGVCDDKPNPKHTYDGWTQLAHIRENVMPAISKLPMVVVGTGARHVELFRALQSKIPMNIPVQLSPLCGSADCYCGEKGVLLADGTAVQLCDYIGLTTTTFNAWFFVSSLPQNTLICAGEELMAALGQRCEKGCLYMLCTQTLSSSIVAAIERPPEPE